MSKLTSRLVVSLSRSVGSRGIILAARVERIMEPSRVPKNYTKSFQFDLILKFSKVCTLLLLAEIEISTIFYQER